MKLSTSRAELEAEAKNASARLKESVAAAEEKDLVIEEMSDPNPNRNPN